MRKVIFGSTGYLGTNLKNFLIKKNEPVITFSRSNSDFIFNLDNNKFNHVEDNLLENDVIFFLSGISSPDYCDKHPELAKKINFINTTRLLRKILAKKCKVIFASTDSVYPDSKNEVYEDSTHSPVGNYGLFKSKVENEFKNEKNFFIARFSYILGGDKFSAYLNSELSTKKEIFKSFSRNVISIDDVLNGLYMFDKKPLNKSINFCGPELLSRMDIAKMYKKNIFSDLILEEIEPPKNFWSSRAKEINMKSKYLDLILESSPRSIEKFIIER